MRAVINTPEMEAEPLQKAAVSNSADIVIPNAPPRSHYIKKFAKNIASKYSYAYALCRSEESLERDGVMLADGLIARWGQAQMLTIMPELIDNPDPGIQDDIANMLDRAERVFSRYDNRGRHAMMHDTRSLHSLFSGLGTSMSEDSKLMRLTHASNILANVQNISVNAISSAPSPSL